MKALLEATNCEVKAQVFNVMKTVQSFVFSANSGDMHGLERCNIGLLITSQSEVLIDGLDSI